MSFLSWLLPVTLARPLEDLDWSDGIFFVTFVDAIYLFHYET